MTKISKVEFLVEETGNCKKVYVPRGYCTIFLQNCAKDHIVTGIVGDDFEIQNLADDLLCQEKCITLGNLDAKQASTNKD